MSIYLDEAASAKPLDSVLAAIKPYIETEWYNPSSIYTAGIKVKEKIESVRRDVAKCINANKDEIYFTSGATESNNHVIRGFDDANYYKDSVIITTPIEHKSIIDAVNNPVLKSDVEFCKVDSKGFVDMKSLKNLLELNKDRKILFSVILANNEIGTIQRMHEISILVHKYNGILHTDATAAFGRKFIDVKELGVDLLSASAQKIGGLKGVGFLYKKNGIKLYPLIYGSQENEMRGGTENVIGIVALGEAIKHIDYHKAEKIIDVRNYMIKQLMQKFDCKVNGDVYNRLPNNINVTFPQNITGEALIYLLDASGIMISSGSACSSNSIKSSDVLKSIGLTDDEAARTIRISLSDDIDINTAYKVICEIDKAIKLLTT